MSHGLFLTNQELSLHPICCAADVHTYRAIAVAACAALCTFGAFGCSYNCFTFCHVQLGAPGKGL